MAIVLTFQPRPVRTVNREPDRDGAEVIPLDRVLATGRLRDLVARLSTRLHQATPPDPRLLGWLVLARDPEGRPVRYLQPTYRAMIGEVPGAPDLAFLDYRHTIRAFACTVADLAAVLESGCMPPEIDLATTTPSSDP